LIHRDCELDKTAYSRNRDDGDRANQTPKVLLILAQDWDDTQDEKYHV